MTKTPFISVLVKTRKKFDYEREDLQRQKHDKNLTMKGETQSATSDVEPNQAKKGRIKSSEGTHNMISTV